MAAPPEGSDPEWPPTNTQGANTEITTRDFSPPSEFRRVTRQYKRRKDGTTATEITRGPLFEFSGTGDGRSAGPDEILRVIADLRGTITQQNDTIQKIASDLTEIKADQQHLKNQNAELQEEVQALRTKLNTLLGTGPTRSWAEVAAREPPQGPNSAPKPPKKELNCVRISTRRTPDDDEDGNDRFGRYLPTDIANAKIRSALLSTDPTKDAQVAGIGTTKTGYVIRFRDSQSAEKAQNNTEWLQELGNDTKLVRPRFGVVVHRTPTEDFDLEGNKKLGIDKLMEENDLSSKGFQIEDIAWLKKKDHPLRTSASLGIWLNTPKAAEYLIANGLLVGQRYIGSVEPYRIDRKRCHRCQRFGHLAWACKQQARCGYCAQQHEYRNCPREMRPRCLDCDEEHPTGDRRCQSPNLTLSQ
jgi:FtsZ-binding cell division protein ZapB